MCCVVFVVMWFCSLFDSIFGNDVCDVDRAFDSLFYLF